ncbi:hypothetical protein ACIBHX_42770, partial [Nonomuraea sp. NPDC050536]|uniref:hypothetical protein n=1 Tax=Nonomuraea sp. NPDC050536 TaxID=3364366 RepID=UPI0037CA4707
LDDCIVEARPGSARRGTDAGLLAAPAEGDRGELLGFKESVLGDHLLRRCSRGARHTDLETMLRHGESELLDATAEDIDDIAAAMVTLAAALQDALTALPENESLPPTIRGAARMATDTAGILHSHYGGDFGGW